MPGTSSVRSASEIHGDLGLPIASGFPGGPRFKEKRCALSAPRGAERLLNMSRYLRVVVTPRCPLACSYCHLEGDPASNRSLQTGELLALLRSGLDAGVRKIKYLGGEPLLRADLPQVIEQVARWDSEVDQSIITSGSLPPQRLSACLEAGLGRANLSIHGWGFPAFSRRKGTERQYGWRRENLDLLLATGRPLKLNYVWGGEEDDADLYALLAWAAGRPLVVNVLDDLGKDIGPLQILTVLKRLRGPWTEQWTEPDPHSLSTLRLRWPDHLVVEVKDQQLGQVAPWRACAACPKKLSCKEGIHAVRLTHDGRLQTCMDRPDLSVDLRETLLGEPAANHVWRQFLEAA